MLINTALLTPRNVLVIAAMAIAWHLVFTPIYQAIASTGDNS